MTVTLTVGYSEFATHLLGWAVMVTEKAEREHEAGYLNRALNIWLILQLGDPHIVIWKQAIHLRSCVWASPPSRKSKRDRGEALVPTHPSAGKGLSTSWGAFLLNSSLAGFPREMYLCTACHPQKIKLTTPPKHDQKTPRQYLLSPDCWSIYLNNTKEIMSAFRTKASALGKKDKELNIVYSQAGISVENSSGSKCPL